MRARGWEFFVTRWQMLAEAFSGVVSSATKQTAPQFSPLEAAKMDVVLKKAVRAKQILQQLQEYGQKQEQLELKFRPVIQQLPALQEQLRPDELSQAAEFALTEGMRQPMMQITGSAAASVSAAQASDPFGIRIAFSPGHPLSLLTWRQYIAIVTRMSKTVEQQLQGPALEALAAFNRERKLLVQELQALRQQLQDQVDIPQLQPLRDETERLDQLLVSLQGLQDAHISMLKKDMAKLGLEMLELKLKLKTGDSFKGSALEQSLRRLQQLHAVAQAGQRVPHTAWVQLDEDLRTVIDSVQNQQQMEHQLEVNIQKFEQQMFRRLAQLQQPVGS